MNSVSLSPKEFGRRFRKALSIELNFDQACSPSILQFINSYSKSIGCNEKSIFFPLLTCCAACMGPNSYIELVPNWQELPIVWTLVITPKILCRIDVGEHLKQQLLAVITELGVKSETPSPVCNKFLVDDITADVLLDVLKSTDGQAAAIYNDTLDLHEILSTSKGLKVMKKLHSGSSWFSSCRMTKKLLSKTQTNFAIVACPNSVQNSLVTCTNFQEVFTNCFLTICAEENHIRYSQLPASSETDSLRRIFKEIITLHMSHSIVYKLSDEAKEKFAEIHDEITDKAKQLARKNADKVFSPILSYLGRLSCILHVLDNTIDAINCCVPIEHSTWSSDISADTVWRARQVLGYVIEQKHVLAQPTIIPTTPQPTRCVDPVTVDDGSPQRQTAARNLFTNRSPSGPMPRATFTNNNSPVSPVSYMSPSRPMGMNRFTPRRRIVGSYGPPRPTAPSAESAFDLLLSNSPANNSNVVVSNVISGTTATEPVIVDVRSAGVSIPVTSAISSSANGSNTVDYNNKKNAVTPQSIALMNNEDFFQTFKVHIRRLLMHEMKEISLAQCVEMKFAPKHSGENPSMEQKTAMARIFLKRLETLGFGIFDASSGMTPRMSHFKKRRFKTLPEPAKQLLSNLRVSEREYDKCFNRQAIIPNANGVVCLE